MNASENHQGDFTFAGYCQLLELAKANYRFVTPAAALAAPDRWVIWRHDVDLSLNRAVCLAEAETAKAVVATYFLNPHSDFYNLLEGDQFRKVKEILRLGHEIGLHFDPAFHAVESEAALDGLVAREVAWLMDWFGTRISAVSFHNPGNFPVACDKAEYGGLVNCYSRTLIQSAGYCSDSNGYWRFKRLHDVLSAGTDRCLQVLTHPEWWQEQPMPPRSRVFRAVYGRAKNALLSYDSILEAAGRQNLSGAPERCRFLKTLDPDRYQLCDYLWNSGDLESLFVELHRLHDRQIARLCNAWLRKEWRVPPAELRSFLATTAHAAPALFQELFGESCASASGASESARERWLTVRDHLIQGGDTATSPGLEEGCVHLCGAIENLARWGREHQALQYDGIGPLEEGGHPTS